MRRNKLTVITILTVFLLCVNGQYHDWYQDYWNMNDWGHMDPYDMGNMQPHDKIHH